MVVLVVLVVLVRTKMANPALKLPILVVVLVKMDLHTDEYEAS